MTPSPPVAIAFPSPVRLNARPLSYNSCSPALTNFSGCPYQEHFCNPFLIHISVVSCGSVLHWRCEHHLSADKLVGWGFLLGSFLASSISAPPHCGGTAPQPFSPIKKRLTARFINQNPRHMVVHVPASHTRVDNIRPFVRPYSSISKTVQAACIQGWPKTTEI